MNGGENGHGALGGTGSAGVRVERLVDRAERGMWALVVTFEVVGKRQRADAQHDSSPPHARDRDPAQPSQSNSTVR